MDALKVFNESCYSKHGWTAEMVVNIFTDLSQIVHIDYSHEEFITAHCKKISPNIFGGIPKHSNFFYLIVFRCKKSIPKWFFEKYVDNEDERKYWIKHVSGQPLLN